MTQALSTEKPTGSIEHVVDVPPSATARLPGQWGFQATQFGGEFLAMLCLGMLQGWLIPGSGPNVAAVRAGVEAAFLLLPVWYLGQGLYRCGGPVAAKRIQRRVMAVGAAFCFIGAQSLLMAPRLSSLLLLCYLLVTTLIVGLLMEGLVRPFLSRKLKARLPALVLGDADFRQLTAEMMRAGADFGGLSPAEPDPDGVVVPWAGVPGWSVRGRGLAPGQEAAFIVPAPGRADGTHLELHDLGGFLGLVYRQKKPHPLQLAAKYALDKLVAGVALLAFLPAILVIALAIKLGSAGPAFYCQVRVGQDGKPIRVWKFRTMVLDAEQRLQEYLAANPAAMAEWKTYFKLKNDPRIIPGVGSFLRKSSLDELPQLFNVLNGTMSLVGPRPFPAYHLEQFPPAFQRLRNSVRPGITGYWQISARSDGDLRVQEALDTYYIRNWSLWLDLHIMASTPYVMLASKGAY